MTLCGNTLNKLTPYKDSLYLQCIILQEAIAVGSLGEFSVNQVNGDVEAGMGEADHILEGEFQTGGQHHWSVLQEMTP